MISILISKMNCYNTYMNKSYIHELISVNFHFLCVSAYCNFECLLVYYLRSASKLIMTQIIVVLVYSSVIEMY